MSVCAVVMLDEPCEIWGGPTRNGKPLIRVDKRYEYVARHRWANLHGALDKSIVLLRQCDERLCVNIKHYRQSRRVLGLPKREPTTPAQYRERNLRQKYGLTLEAYDALLEEQGGVCAVCLKDDRDRLGRRLAVDHDHETGAVRGLLCTYCNKALGHAKDDPERLRALAAYLERSRSSLSAQ